MMCSNCSWSRLAILCSLSDSLSPHELAVIRWCFIVGHVLLAAIFKRIMGGIILCNGFDCKLFYGLFPVCTCQLICLIILDASYGCMAEPASDAFELCSNELKRSRLV